VICQKAVPDCVYWIILGKNKITPQMRKLLLLTVLVAAFGCAEQKAEAQSHLLKPDEAEKMIKENPNLQVVDVRTVGEVEKGKIKGASHVDYYSSSFRTDVEKLDKSKPVLVYCAKGGRSSSAAKILKSKGYNVYDLQGGMTAWKAAGKEVE
jgi:rhodanese-related sulfurtransferase